MSGTRWFLFSLLLVVLAVAADAAPKRDLVVMSNGDQLTGEIKGLDRGRLAFKTTATDNISIDMDYVLSITGYGYFAAEDRWGNTYFGAILPDSTDISTVVFVGPMAELPRVRLSDLVEIRPVKSSFWGKVDGSVDLGFSYTQASKTLSYTLNGDIKYREDVFDLVYKLSSTLNNQDTKTTRRNDTNLTFTRHFGRQFGAARATLQNNPEQGYDLRLIGSLLAGTYAVRDNSKLWSMGAGLSVTRETPVDTTASTTELEGLISTTFSLYFYQTPKRTLDAVLNVYPGITRWGRIRVDLQANTRLEVVKDFYLSANLLQSYDTDPPTEGAAKNDITFSFSVGLSF